MTTEKTRCASRNYLDLQCQRTEHKDELHLFVNEESKPAEEPLLEFFAFAHLPEHLAEVSKPFAEVADKLVLTLPVCRMRQIALEKLIESKDAAVRARIASRHE